AAVAATTTAIANQAMDLIEVEYEVLPFVIDVEEAMAPDAPILHEDLFTAGVDPKPEQPSNIAKVVAFKKGDVEAGFAEADDYADDTVAPTVDQPQLGRSLETAAYLARNWKFESIPLQRSVSDEPCGWLWQQRHNLTQPEEFGEPLLLLDRKDADGRIEVEEQPEVWRQPSGGERVEVPDRLEIHADNNRPDKQINRRTFIIEAPRIAERVLNS
ncbi:hypothetical protein B4Q13_14940, partial [Lacticaseibacillus rhamnosus]